MSMALILAPIFPLRIPLLALLLLTPAGSTSNPRVQASVTSRGVRLTLILPSRAYPRNALLRATVKVRNNSAASLTVRQPSCRADGPSPAVQVLNRNGQVVFPPPLKEPPLQGTICMTGPPPPLLPHHILTQKFYVIARSDRIRAVIWSGSELSMETPVVHIRLVPAQAPKLVLVTGPSVHATVSVHNPRKKQGFLYTEWYSCPDLPRQEIGGTTFYERVSTGGAPSVTGRVFNWAATSGRRISPGCINPVEWHAAVGQLGQPVSYLDYVKR